MSKQTALLRMVLALLLMFALVGAVACSSSTTDEGTASGETDATTDGDSGETPSASSGLSAEQENQAIDIAAAYFVAQTDFTKDQFEWTVEAAAQDNDGQWWARVSADPGDTSLEIEQIYVFSPADSDFWFAHDMGTGIDPPTDESFPEEVRDEL